MKRFEMFEDELAKAGYHWNEKSSQYEKDGQAMDMLVYLLLAIAQDLKASYDVVVTGEQVNP